MDDKCKCWDLESAECLWEVKCDAGITAIKAYEDHVYIGLSTGCLMMLDTNTGRETLKQHYCEKKINYID